MMSEKSLDVSILDRSPQIITDEHLTFINDLIKKAEQMKSEWEVIKYMIFFIYMNVLYLGSYNIPIESEILLILYTQCIFFRNGIFSVILHTWLWMCFTFYLKEKQKTQVNTTMVKYYADKDYESPPYNVASDWFTQLTRDWQV